MTPLPTEPSSQRNRRPARAGRHRSRCAVVSLAAALFVTVAAASAGDARAQRLPTLAEAHAGDDFAEAVETARRLIGELMSEAGLPGASVAVGVGGEIVWSEGFGWADIENRVAVSPLTKFRVGSVSKSMTAAGLGLLVEAGRLDLDAPVQTYVPEFPEKRWTVTTRQLGGHLAGIRHYRGREMLSSDRYATVAAGLEIFDDDSLLFEPGTDYSYSSYGWNLISAVMEGASGRDFLAYMRDEVFEPLGLRHTVADYNDSIIVNRTEFYERDQDGALVNAPYVDNSNKWAGGGFLSTPEDLVRFGQAHLRPGFLRAETLALLHTSQTLANGEATNYGIGWRSGTQSDGDRTISHSGGSVGGSTLLLLVPEHDLVVAGVVNVSGPVGRIVSQVAETFEAAIEGSR